MLGDDMKPSQEWNPHSTWRKTNSFKLIYSNGIKIISLFTGWV